MLNNFGTTPNNHREIIIAALCYPVNKRSSFFLLVFAAYFQLAQAQIFSEVAQQSGIDHLYYSGMLIGGGAAFFDYDNDGFLDIYLTNGGRGDRLYHNLGNGQFAEVGTLAGIRSVTKNRVTTGVITGDVDNDGFDDIFVTTMVPFPITGFNYLPNILFHNNGDGTFTNVSASSGITQREWSVSATFGDYNLDGYLDIYVGNYLRAAGFIRDPITNDIIGYTHVGIPNLFYINNGDGTFRQDASTYRINDAGTTLAVAFTDYDNDADMDIYVVNDFGEWALPNALYRNEYPADSFTNVSAISGANIALYGMGLAIGDYDEDRDLDYYVTNIGKNVLLQNQNNQTFIDTTDSAGVANTYSDTLLTTGWGTQFLDYDNDTYLDLFVANGYIGTPPFIASNERDPCKLYKNNANGTFNDISVAAGIGDSNRARGSIYGDYDNDGDLDLLVVAIEVDSSSPLRTLLFRNDQSTGNHWLKVKLHGTTDNRNGFGSRLTLYANGRQWIREIDGGSSHASHNSSIAHFGLGAYTAVDSLVVIWPGGDRQVITNIGIDQQLNIIQNTGGALMTNVSGIICEGDSFLTGNSYRTATGIYRDTLTTAFGMDSIVITDLMVLPVKSHYSEISICATDSFLAGGIFQTHTGIYYDTLLAANGCDSVVETDLFIYPEIIFQDTVTICAGDSFFAAGAFRHAAGTYYDTLTAVGGCDSVMILKLHISTPGITGDSVMICPGEMAQLSAPPGFVKYLWLSSMDTSRVVEGGPGNYELQVEDAHGCMDTALYVITASEEPGAYVTPDSITIRLGESVDLHVFTSGSIDSMNVQWFPATGLNCATCDTVAAAPLSGITYQVVVTDQDGCQDTAMSVITVIDTVTGLKVIDKATFTVFPNPVDQVLNIWYHLPSSGQVNIGVLDMQGRKYVDVLNQSQPAGVHHLSYIMDDIPPGMYWLMYSSPGMRDVRKIIVIRR